MLKCRTSTLTRIPNSIDHENVTGEGVIQLLYNIGRE
jgi:hypothetical protein